MRPWDGKLTDTNIYPSYQGGGAETKDENRNSQPLSAAGNKIGRKHRDLGGQAGAGPRDSTLLRLCEKSGVLCSLPPATAPDSHFYSPRSSVPLQKMNSFVGHRAEGVVPQPGGRASSPRNEGSPRPAVGLSWLSGDSPAALRPQPTPSPTLAHRGLFSSLSWCHLSPGSLLSGRPLRRW